MKSVVCFVLACIGIISPVLADAASSMRELADVQAKITQIGRDVKKLAAAKFDQIEQLRRLEKQYGDQVNAVNAVKAEIKQQEKVLQDVRGKITATQKNLSDQQRSLEGLIKSVYAMGGKQGLDVLLNQRDPAVSGRMLIYYDYIRKARLQKLLSIEHDVNALKQLEAQKNTEAQLLQVALEKKRQEADALQALKVQRNKLLSQLKKDFAAKQEQLVSLIHDEKKLEAIVASLHKSDDSAAQISESRAPVDEVAVINKPKPRPEKPILRSKRLGQTGETFAQLRGKLPWPVPGAIVERFGGRRFETRWDGTVIGAREGAAIHAVADGQVVYADWLRGYGLMIIVDHGKGYMSLYAFNQSLHKSVGDFVRAGDIVASVGRSGGRSQAALYFGIRIKGRAVDPEKWCRKLGRG